jgi:hypothetical protein
VAAGGTAVRWWRSRWIRSYSKLLVIGTAYTVTVGAGGRRRSAGRLAQADNGWYNSVFGTTHLRVEAAEERSRDPEHVAPAVGGGGGNSSCRRLLDLASPSGRVMMVTAKW